MHLNIVVYWYMHVPCNASILLIVSRHPMVEYATCGKGGDLCGKWGLSHPQVSKILLQSRKLGDGFVSWGMYSTPVLKP